MIRSPQTALMLIAAFAVMTACATADAQDEPADSSPVVITATQATYSIASALSVGTPLEVINIPDDGREFELLRPYLERRKNRLSAIFASATAVVSLTNALPADPLYRYARAANVRIVNIDAAIPWTYDAPGVSLADAPSSDVDWAQDSERLAQNTVSPYFWLSVSNSIRMADIVASDFQRLFPAYADQLAGNLDQLKSNLLELNRRYRDQLLVAADDTVFALTGDFVYLTNDLGLFVDGYFVKQDVDWTDNDYAALTAYLRDRDIGVVIHKWVPDAAITAAIEAGGAQLVVLDTGNQGHIVNDVLAADGLQQILENNLRKISAALSE